MGSTTTTSRVGCGVVTATLVVLFLIRGKHTLTADQHSQLRKLPQDQRRMEEPDIRDTGASCEADHAQQEVATGSGDSADRRRHSQTEVGVSDQSGDPSE